MTVAIVYASLQPFANWMAPVAGTPFFLFAPWPPRWVRYDIVTNCAWGDADRQTL